MKLKGMAAGSSARIVNVGGEGAVRQHLLDMGIIPGAEVTIVKYAPLGDPVELRVHSYELSLGLDETEMIEVEPIETADVTRQEKVRKKGNEHPGLGEGGRFHPKGSGNPLPDSQQLTFALVGNQNCGKTTLFNQLTGARQHVGNFPGVTVDRKDGAILGYENTLITDLPGIYSMSPYSAEELVSRDFVLNNRPRAIINIVDATNIERNLYLTMQLLEMDIPVVVALNMMDEVIGNGGYIDVNIMEEMLGTPVIPISAAKSQGINELVEHAIHVAKYQEKPLKQDFCDQNDNNGAVHRALHAVSHLIEDHAGAAGLPVRFAADKAIEGDKRIIEQLELDDNEKDMLEHITVQMENERGLDRNAAISDMRFAFILKVCRECVTRSDRNQERERSSRIDRILTGKYTGIPIFILIMGMVFLLTFNVVGAALQNLIAAGIGYLERAVDQLLTASGVNSAVHGLIIGGIFRGVGSVLSFLPIIVTMFFFLSILEDSGYIARVAFIMDKPMRRLGLSGRSIVPMLTGFGCTVPAVMSSRTLPSERDRKMTILMIPFMSCTAKLPVYAFFADIFFPHHKALVMTALYFLGIVVAMLVSFLYKHTFFKGEAVPFVMELPNYRMPKMKNVIILMWEKTKDFIQKAFSIILLATIIVWFLQSFDLRFNLVSDSSESILAVISGWFVPVFKPVGLGEWRIVTSMFVGVSAKEAIITTMLVLFEDAGGVENVVTAVTAVPLLVFSLLYTPCVAAVSSVRNELGARWAWFMVIWHCVIAWMAAFIAYHIMV